jgi:hypothetical protein
MLEYIDEIKRQFIAEYGFAENPEKPGVPLDVPDGEYPMTINGKLDNVRIVNGMIYCCNFEETAQETEIKTVILKNDTELQEPLAILLLASLKHVQNADPIAFYELVHLARDSEHELWTGGTPFSDKNPLQLLRDLSLIDADNRMGQTIREFVLCAVEGDDLEMKVVNPLKESMTH